MSSSVVQAIYSYIEPIFQVAHPGIPLVFKNQPFDWASPPSSFVFLEVKFYDGNQIGVAANPRTRSAGMIYATSYCREGTGSLESIRKLETIGNALKYRKVGTAQVQAPEFVDLGAPPEGWHTDELKLAFYADET